MHIEVDTNPAYLQRKSRHYYLREIQWTLSFLRVYPEEMGHHFQQKNAVS